MFKKSKDLKQSSTFEKSLSIACVKKMLCKVKVDTNGFFRFFTKTVYFVIKLVQKKIIDHAKIFLTISFLRFTIQ